MNKIIKDLNVRQQNKNLPRRPTPLLINFIANADLLILNELF